VGVEEAAREDRRRDLEEQAEGGIRCREEELFE
jgi:hypothetical protein